MNGIRITAGQVLDVVTIEEPAYKGLAKAIGADIFEVVHPNALEEPLLMIADEEGRVTLRKLNLFASLLCASPIFGDVLIMQDAVLEDGEHDIVGLDDETIDFIVDQIDSLAYIVPVDTPTIKNRKE